MATKLRRTMVPTAITLAITATGLASPVGAQPDEPVDDWQTLQDLGFEQPDQEQRTEAVIHYTTEGSVKSVETVEDEDEETVISLASDILFDTDKADLSKPARTKIRDLVADVPRDAELAVYGHTDTRANDEHNQDLSERRADAVAGVVRDARPDLQLDVQGFGETELKVRESGDDIAEDQAANRRVELRYTS